MNTFRNIDRSRFIFDFLLYKRTDDGFEQEAESLGAKIFTYPSRNRGWRQYLRELNEFFINHAGEYDAVHFSGNSFTELMPVKIAKRYGIPIRIVHCHNTATEGLHNQILHKLNRKTITKTATDFLACSDGAREWGYRNSEAYKKSIVLPNGIELDKFRFNPEARKEIREKLSISSDAILIGHTGSFRAVKNHLFLINIFEKIKKINQSSVLLLCGKGETEEDVRNLVKEKGLCDSVRFLGVRNDINKILSAIDVYVFPSLYEGLPFALIEAQAAGLPILASNSISPEIKLTPSIQFMSLDSSDETWAEKALKLVDKDRTEEIHTGLLPYDIITTCRILEDIYDGKKR